jgi:uncharacterized protein YjdB
MRSRVQLSGEGGRAAGEAGRGERTRGEGGAFRGTLRDAALVLCAVLFVAGCGDGAQEENIEAVRLEVSPLEVDVAEGEAVTLTATLLDSNGRRLGEGHAKYAFTWWVANDGIVRVEPQGRTATVRYISPGSTIVRVTAVRSWDAPPPGMSPNVGSGKGLSGDSKVNSRQKPAALTAASGNKQKSRVKTVLPDELVVRVLDKQGKPIAGQKVTFRAMAGGGTMTPEQTLTDSLGYASARWELGPTAGPQQADVSVSGVESVVFEAEAVPGEPASMHVVAGDGQTGSVSQALATDLIVIVRDAFGNPVPGAAVTWSVVSGGGTLRTIVSPTGTDGQSIARWTLGPNTGGQQASATAGPLAAAFTATAVAPSTVASLTVTPDAVTLDGLGLSTQLTAVAKDASGNTLTGVTIQWTSSNTGTATVDGSGRVTAKAVGTALIIAAAAGVADTAHFTVRQVPTSIELSPASLALAVGESAELRATVKDAGSSLIPNPTVSWRSSATSIATVSDAGLVKGVADGSASIAATSGSAAAEAAVRVAALAPPPSAFGAIWISSAEIAALPTSGEAWRALLRDAQRDPGAANIADQNSNHDVYTLAAALVCARTAQYCDKARRGVLDAIGTEHNNQPGTDEPAAWLEVGRNLGAYVIAADILGLRADGNPSSAGSQVEDWIRGWLGKTMPANRDGQPMTFEVAAFNSGSNASAQQGFAFAAVAAFLGDRPAIEHAWNKFRRYACDPAAPDRNGIDLRQGVNHGWAHDDANPCAVNPLGSTKRVPDGLPGAGTVQRIDGAIINDMRRGDVYQWQPVWTQYPWVGLEGFVPAALVLHRAGYPAFDVADRAVLRATEYLYWLSQETGEVRWFDGDRGRAYVQLVNWHYGTSLPRSSPVAGSRTVGYTDWTHPKR